MTAFEVAAEATIDRPAWAVWPLLADYANDTAWRTGVVSMTAAPPGIAAPGTRTVEHLRFAGRTWHNTAEVGTVDPGTRMTWHTVAGAEAEGSRSVTPLTATRCLVRLELKVTPHGAQRPLVRVLAHMLQRNLRRDLAALRDLALATAAVREGG